MKNVFFITKVDGNVLNKYKVALLHKNKRALCKLTEEVAKRNVNLGATRTELLILYNHKELSS